MTSTMRLEDAGFPLLHHRLWAIFGWFTPIWLFFRPYQMVSQLYVGSLPSFSPASKIDWERQPDDVVGIWWGCFIAMTISLKVSDRPGMALFFGTAFALGAAYCITRVMLRVEWRLGERACKTRPIRWPGKVLLFLLIALNLGIVGQHGFEPAGHKLRMAAKETDLKAVQDILDQGIDVNSSSEDGITALMTASDSGRAEVAGLLIQKGAAVNSSDTDGSTALMYAARGGHADVVNLLIQHGAEVNTAGKDGGTALERAVIGRHSEIAQLLIQNGAKVNATKEGDPTALMGAAANGDADLAGLLINHGAKVNAVSSELGTALMLAAEGGRVDVVRLLLKAGADVSTRDKDGHTALDIAKRSRHEDVADLLSRPKR